jgi:hypothetical protein
MSASKDQEQVMSDCKKITVASCDEYALIGGCVKVWTNS